MLKGIIPGSQQLTKRAIMTAVTIPEGIIMLTIAVFLDIIGFVLFIVSLAGAGIPLSFLLDILGIVTIGFWANTRSLFRGVIEKSVSNITERVSNIGPAGNKAPQNNPSASGLKAGKNLAKGGVKTGLSIARFLINLVIELIPFLGDVFPGWTIFVIFEMVQGEI